MTPKRPPAVLVIAILHFVFGGFDLLGGLCGLALIASGAADFFAKLGGPNQGLNQVEMQQALDAKLPAYKAVRFSDVGIALVLGTLLVAGGFGLLTMKPWGRTLSLAYALLSSAYTIFRMIYALALEMPEMRLYLEDKLQQAPAGPQRGGLEMAMVLMTVMPIIVHVAALIYPTAVLIIMFRPSIRAAFRGERTVASISEQANDPEAEDRWRV